jgi:hypothetical protein
MNANKEYQYQTADISEFINEIQQPKQEFEQSASIFDELPEPSSEIDEKERSEPIRTQMTAGAANASGKLVVSVIDSVIPALQAWYAKTEADEFKADASSRDELQAAFAEYMKLKGGDIPPAMMCLILVLVIYGSNIPKMLEMRKLNTQKELLDKREKELTEREKKLSKQENNE